jgi:hypothetical protein
MAIFGYFFVLAYTIVRVILGCVLFVLKGILCLITAFFRRW